MRNLRGGLGAAVSLVELAAAVLAGTFAVLVVRFCDGDEAGTDACAGVTPGERVYLVAMLLLGSALAVGALASIALPAFDRRRLLYRIPAATLLVGAAGITKLAF